MPAQVAEVNGTLVEMPNDWLIAFRCGRLLMVD
jgi:hypothetical protein